MGFIIGYAMRKLNQKIIQIVSLFSFFFILVNCSRQTVENSSKKSSINSSPLVLIIYESDDFDSRGMMEHLMMSMNYAKIPVQLINLSHIRKTLSIPISIRTVYITTSATEKLSDKEIQELVFFVARGGVIVQTTLTWDPRMHFLIGIKRDASLDIDSTAIGWYFHKTVLPGISNSDFRTEVMPLHKGFTKNNFIHEIDKIATALNNENYLVLTLHSIGKGKVFYFNTTILNDKLYRGLLFSIGLIGLEGIPYPVANVSTIFLDDFPAALYNTRMYPVDEEFGVDQANFICKIWWPDMVALADTFHLAYTAMICFNYNDVNFPPYDFDQWYNAIIKVNNKQVKASPWIAKKVLQNGFELGFHGYNHLSLWKDDWQNMKYILPSLYAVRKQWYKDDLGPLPVTYVPPSNWIDSTGLQFLHKGLPSIKYMCSLYLGETEDGGNREFDTDPYQPALFDVPRITSGYYNTNENYFVQESVYILTGVWTHFIHPDDIFFENTLVKQIFKKRNYEKLWWKKTPGKKESLYSKFRKWIIRNKMIHPLIRYKTIKQGGPLIEKWRSLELIHRDSLNQHVVIHYNKIPNDTTYYFIYSSNNFSKDIEKRIKKNSIQYGKTNLWEGYLFEFSSKNDTLKFPLLHKIGTSDKNQIQNILQQYKNYIAELKQVNPEKPKINFLTLIKKYSIKKLGNKIFQKILKEAVEQNRLDIAIQLLENRILMKNEWYEEDATLLIKYLYWDNRPQYAWDIVKKRIQKYPTIESLMFKKLVERNVETPEDFDPYEWFLVEYKIRQDKEILILNFLAQNDSPDIWYKLKPFILNEIKTKKVSDHFVSKIVKRLFWYENDENILQFVEQLPAKYYSSLKPYARQIAQLYAYNRHDYSRAFIWSQQDSTYPVQEQMEWLLQQKRYQDLLETGNSYLSKHPDNDSLRYWFGTTLLDEGFIEEGLKILKSLPEQSLYFKKAKAKVSKITRYQKYRRKRKIIQNYPQMITENLRDSLQLFIKWNERPSFSIEGHYHDDNFNNTVYEITSSLEWGWENKLRKKISVMNDWITTGIAQTSGPIQLKGFLVEIFKKDDERSRQLNIGGGFHFYQSKIFPQLSFIYSTGNYNSFSLTISPELTVPSIQKNILKFKIEDYFEHNWIRNILSTALYGALSYMSDNNWVKEGSVRLMFWKKEKEKLKFYPSIEIAYQDATDVYPSGLPYWTPNKLSTMGLGGVIESRKKRFKFSAESFIRKDNQSGWYGTFLINNKLFIGNKWKINAIGYMSTSKVYRYNEFRIGISRNF